jgi:hypothetical protein
VSRDTTSKTKDFNSILENSKRFELRAEYRAADCVVVLSLWRRGEPDKGGDPVDETLVPLCNGYPVAMRLARRVMLERHGLRDLEVLGA